MVSRPAQRPADVLMRPTQNHWPGQRANPHFSVRFANLGTRGRDAADQLLDSEPEHGRWVNGAGRGRWSEHV